MSKLSIVIVNWNSWDFLKLCLPSIKKNIAECEVFVVDNASSDESVIKIKKNFLWVSLIANKKNLGFAKGNNQALKRVRSEFVLILNPDIVILPKSIQTLINFLEENPRVVSVGPILLNPDKSIQRKGYYHRFPTLWQTFFFYTQLSDFFKRFPKLVEKYWESNIETEDVIEVDQIPGACLLSRTKDLKEVEFFNERYPLWFEDVELCFKLKKRGKLMLIPTSQVIHFGGGSINKWEDDIAKQIRFFKSLFLFFDQNKDIIRRILVRVIILFDLSYLILIRSVKYILKPREDKLRFIKIKWQILNGLLRS